MASSFLKWVGGKSRLSDDLVPLFPSKFERYIEPFFGSGAMFFSFRAKSDIFSNSIPSLLNDANELLINCHIQVRDNYEKLVTSLRQMEMEYASFPEETFNLVRSRFQDKDKNNISRATDFVLINKTCFNGLWRVNGKGKFNVPWNNKKSVSLCVNISKCSKELSTNAQLFNYDFEKFIYENVKEGDFVFLDPPYHPVSSTSSFVSYTENGWSSGVDDGLDGKETDDQRLLRCMKEIHNRKAFFMMTNSDADFVKDFFGKDYVVDTVQAHRFIRAQKPGEVREKVNELIVKNYEH